MKNKDFPKHWGHLKITEGKNKGKCECEASPMSKKELIEYAENEIKEWQQFIKDLRRQK